MNVPGRSIKKSILVVDDNRDVADALGRLIKLLGREAEVVYGGREGINTAMAKNPDIIFLDLSMPEVSGYEVARELRARNFCGLIVAVSGLGSDQDREQTARAGFDRHFTKPLGAEDLKNFLTEHGMAEEIVP